MEDADFDVLLAACHGRSWNAAAYIVSIEDISDDDDR